MKWTYTGLCAGTTWSRSVVATSIALACAAVLATGATAAVMEHPPAPPESAVVESTLPPPQTQQAILQALKAIHDPDLRQRYRSAYPFGSPLFPRDDDLRAFGDQANGRVSPALEHWLALPPAQRAYDLWISPNVDYYWASDYSRDGEPVEFSAEFLVHLRAVAEAKTEVTVLQIHSKTRMGKKFDLLGRAGPGFYWDIRPVEASPRASADLLNLLARTLAKQRQQRESSPQQ